MLCTEASGKSAPFPLFITLINIPGRMMWQLPINCTVSFPLAKFSFVLIMSTEIEKSLYSVLPSTLLLHSGAEFSLKSQL